jgi:hypothetical protein
MNEALTLAETDLDPRRRASVVRRGKGGKRREVGNGRVGVRARRPVAATPIDAAGGTLFSRAQASAAHIRRHKNLTARI